MISIGCVFVGLSVYSNTHAEIKFDKISQQHSGIHFNNQINEDSVHNFLNFANDNDLDLYVVSGGNEFDRNSARHRDRLYINDGRGNFHLSSNLPNIQTSGLRVIAGDYDNDGDLDLFVGGRVVPGRYPQAPNSYLLNNHHGRFTDVTQQRAKGIGAIGMVTDADFVDVDNDGDLDLLLVGEWMPITVFENIDGNFVDVTKKLGLADSTGWWLSLAHGDFDRDGDTDFVAGNIGLNNKYQPTHRQSLSIYANDFDGNASLDLVLAINKNHHLLPVRGRQCSAEQVPGLKRKFPTFKAFAEADLPSIYSSGKLATALTLKAEIFSHSMIINQGKKGFVIRPLANQAQYSPVSGIVVDDFNLDNHLDILYTGNFYAAEVETVRYDASICGLLLGDGKTGFKPVEAARSGFVTPKNARDLQLIKLGHGNRRAVIVTNNSDQLQVFSFDSSK